MKVVAVMGSYRKGRTIDTLVDRAIRGLESAGADAEVDKIILTDRHIEYCRNCGACRRDDPAKPIAHAYEVELHDHYGIPGYWMHSPV